MNERLDNGKGKLGGNIRELGILIAFIAIIIFLIVLSPDAFAKPSNLINIVKQASINGILACGMMFVIISGGIDLSVGSTAALAGVMAAHFSHPGGYPLIVPILIALAVGALVGLVNGIGVAYGEIPPFIITLGTMTAVRGVSLIASGGAPVFNVSKSFEYVASGFAFGIPLLAIYFGAIVLISAFLLTQTVFGRRVYMIGGNEVAAKVSGIHVKRMKIFVYMVAGTLAGFAGMLLASRTVSGSPTAGNGYELDAIAAVIIGGISMAGGAGKWYGTVIGALMIAVIGNGLDILGVSSHYQLIIKGAIIVFAVLIDIKSKSKND